MCGAEERKEHYHSLPHQPQAPPPPAPSPPRPPPGLLPGSGDLALPWPLLPAAKRAAGAASEAPSPPESRGTFAPNREKKLIINHQVNGDVWGAEGTECCPQSG